MLFTAYVPIENTHIATCVRGLLVINPSNRLANAKVGKVNVQYRALVFRVAHPSTNPNIAIVLAMVICLRKQVSP
jgi:hypothetical protein